MPATFVGLPVEQKKEAEKVKLEAYVDGNLRIEFAIDPRGASGDERRIVALFSSLRPIELTDINLQVAVQKNVKMVQLSPASGNSIQGAVTNGLTQEMRVINTLDGTKAIAMKIKVTYRCAGQTITDTKLATFPLNA